MNKQKKSVNRKALPKFFGIILISAFFGGIAGGLFSFMSDTNLPDTITSALSSTLTIISPYCIWISTLLFSGIGFIFYLQARNSFQCWDGEEEILIAHTEKKLSLMLLMTIINMLLDFFFFGLSFVLIKGDSTASALAIIGFLLSIAAIIILQQKAIDLTRKINPEKQGSVYDTKFQKKWIASCDENEQRKMGQAAFKAFNVVNYTCIALWLFLMLLSLAIPVGILPIILVMFIWGISQITYGMESMRLE